MLKNDYSHWVCVGAWGGFQHKASILLAAVNPAKPFSSLDSLSGNKQWSEINREPVMFQLTRRHAFCPVPVTSVSFIYGIRVFSVLCYLLLRFPPVFLCSCAPPRPVPPSKTALHQLRWPSPEPLSRERRIISVYSSGPFPLASQ